MRNRTPVEDSRLQAQFHVDDPRPQRPWQLRVGFWFLLAIAAYYLFTEHQAHLAWGLPYLPFLILAACPLIHLFAHGGHGGHRGHPPRQRPPGTGTSPSRKTGLDVADRNADATHHRHGGYLP